MTVSLEGGCIVRGMKEGVPFISGTASVWSQVSRKTGAKAISLHVLEFAPGISPGLSNQDCDEVLYFLEQLDGATPSPDYTTVYVDGCSITVGTQTGIYIQPNQTFTIENRSARSIYFVSVQCPEPSTSVKFVDPMLAPSTRSLRSKAAPTVSLNERRAIPTGDRWYRVLVDAEVGSKLVTQFVGSIPPGRAPDHFHEYEEVLFILKGQGRMWAGASHTPIGPGSCVYLPRQQVHCVENTGQSELRLLGVFYPAGSPSVRYEA